MQVNRNPHVSAEEARRLGNRRQRVESDIVEKLHQQFDDQVKRHATSVQAAKPLTFKVPSFLFGFPLFDHERIISKLAGRLRKHGFVVQRLNKEGDLMVSYKKEKKEKEEREKQTPFSLDNLKKLHQQIEVNKSFGWA